MPKATKSRPGRAIAEMSSYLPRDCLSEFLNTGNHVWDFQ